MLLYRGTVCQGTEAQDISQTVGERCNGTVPTNRKSRSCSRCTHQLASTSCRSLEHPPNTNACCIIELPSDFAVPCAASNRVGYGHEAVTTSISWGHSRASTATERVCRVDVHLRIDG